MKAKKSQWAFSAEKIILVTHCETIITRLGMQLGTIHKNE